MKGQKKMKKLLSLMLCLIMTLAMTNISFAYKVPTQYSSQRYSLDIPEDATVIEITEDNFDEFFEDVEVTQESERECGYSNNSTKTANIICHANIPQHIHGLFSRNSQEGALLGYGMYNEVLEYWLIEVLTGPALSSWLVGAMYDEINNILYCFDSFYVNIKTVDSVTITKYKQTSFGMIEKFNITHMTAKLKKFPYVTVTYNGEMIMFDQKPVIEEGRTLVPLRAIFEKLGAEIDWNGETSTVTATKDGTTISLTINNTTATKNGEAISLDVPAKIINGRTLVPVRFISDCFGVNVEWDGNARRVILTK